MDRVMVATAPTALTAGERVLIGIAAYFLALKVLFAFWAFPTSDEAYYWLWGQHLALSYYDHPPLQAWLLGLSSAVFGHNVFALRWPTLAAFAGNLWVFHAVARQVMGENWRPMFLKSTVIYLAAPLFGFFGTVAFNDYLLVFLLLTSGYWFIRYFAAVEQTGRGPLAHLLAAAVLLGLAGLAKYNAVFLGLAVAGAVITRPKLRPLLLRWELYAAAALAIAMQAPVIVWNLQHGFASFEFHLVARYRTQFEGVNVAGMKAFAAEFLALVSPFLLPAVFLFFWARQPGVFERIGKTLAIWAFWLSTAVCLYIANFAYVLWWWNITALVLVLPFAGRYAGPVLIGLHSLWGFVVNTFLAVSFAVVPLGALFGGVATMETDYAYGWDEVAAAVREAQAMHGAGFVASNRYQTAGQLAFALGEGPVVTELSPRRTAFDDWFDDAAYLGHDAVVLVDGRDDVTFWSSQFVSVEPLGEVRTQRFGLPLARYELYLARTYQPTAEP